MPTTTQTTRQRSIMSNQPALTHSARSTSERAISYERQCLEANTAASAHDRFDALLDLMKHAYAIEFGDDLDLVESLGISCAFHCAELDRQGD